MVRPVIIGFGKLGRRLTVAFLGVALVASIVMFALIETSTRLDINTLATQQEEALSDSVAITTAALHDNVAWQDANLGPVLDLVEGQGAAVEVRDAHDSLVEATPGFAKIRASRVFMTPIIVRHTRVGQVTLKFTE